MFYYAVGKGLIGHCLLGKNTHRNNSVSEGWGSAILMHGGGGGGSSHPPPPSLLISYRTPNKNPPLTPGIHGFIENHKFIKVWILNTSSVENGRNKEIYRNLLWIGSMERELHATIVQI